MDKIKYHNIFFLTKNLSIDITFVEMSINTTKIFNNQSL